MWVGPAFRCVTVTAKRQSASAMGSRWATLKALDAFPKFEREFQRHTTSGGSTTLAVAFLLLLLLGNEFATFHTLERKQEFLVESLVQQHVMLSLDMLVLARCS